MKHGIFGVSTIALYSRATGLPVTLMEIIGGCEFPFTAEYTDLQGGSQMYPFDSEISGIKSDVSITAREYSAKTLEKFLGAVSTEREAELNGAVDEIANVKGSSIIAPTTGIASVSVIPTTGAVNLKSGRYVIKAVDTDTIDIYATQNIDNTRGVVVVPDENCRVVKNLDISLATTDVAALGIRITKGSGTLAFVTDDTAEFWVRKPNESSYDVEFGQMSPSFDEYGLLCFGQKASDGSVNAMQIYRAKLGGMPVSFKEKGWSEWSGTIKPIYDPVRGAVGRFRRIQM